MFAGPKKSPSQTRGFKSESFGIPSSSQSSGLTRRQTVSTSFERVVKSPSEQKMINAFKMVSVRQVGFWIGDKLVDGIGNIVYLKWIRAALKVGVAQHMKAAF